MLLDFFCAAEQDRGMRKTCALFYIYIRSAEIALKYAEGAGKTVFYAWPSGAMAHGAYEVNGIAYHFDEVTGALDASQQAPEPMLSAGMVSPISLSEGIADGSVTSVRIIGDSIMFLWLLLPRPGATPLIGRLRPLFIPSLTISCLKTFWNATFSM